MTMDTNVSCLYFEYYINLQLEIEPNSITMHMGYPKVGTFMVQCIPWLEM